MSDDDLIRRGDVPAIVRDVCSWDCGCSGRPCECGPIIDALGEAESMIVEEIRALPADELAAAARESAAHHARRHERRSLKALCARALTGSVTDYGRGFEEALRYLMAEMDKRTKAEDAYRAARDGGAG